MDLECEFINDWVDRIFWVLYYGLVDPAGIRRSSQTFSFSIE